MRKASSISLRAMKNVRWAESPYFVRMSSRNRKRETNSTKNKENKREREKRKREEERD